MCADYYNSPGNAMHALPVTAYPAQARQSPVYPAQARQSPVYPAQAHQSPTYPAQARQSPTYPAQARQSPAYPAHQSSMYPARQSPVHPAQAYQTPVHPAQAYPLQGFQVRLPTTQTSPILQQELFGKTKSELLAYKKEELKKVNSQRKQDFRRSRKKKLNLRKSLNLRVQTEVSNLIKRNEANLNIMLEGLDLNLEALKISLLRDYKGLEVDTKVLAGEMKLARKKRSLGGELEKTHKELFEKLASVHNEIQETFANYRQKLSSTNLEEVRKITEPETSTSSSGTKISEDSFVNTSSEISRALSLNNGQTVPAKEISTTSKDSSAPAAEYSSSEKGDLPVDSTKNEVEKV